MNTDQVNKTNMYQATNLVLIDPANQPIWSGLAAFVRAQTRHAGSLNILGALAQSQGAPLTGITVDKTRLQESVVTRTGIVAGMAGPYAFEAGNATLAAKFNIPDRDVINAADALVDDIAQGVHDEAAKLLAADPAKMLEYGLIQAVLDDLQSAITAYSATVGTPRAAIAGRGAITKALAAEIARADANLTEVLDRLMRQFAADHRAFVDAYTAARKIINLGGPAKPKPAKSEPGK